MRTGSVIQTFVFLVFCGVLYVSPSLAAPRVEAVLDQKSFALGEFARLSIVVSGGQNDLQLEEPEIENVRLHPRGRTNQISSINGRVSSSLTYNYLVEALAPGRYTIPPFTLHLGAKTLQTAEIDFQVTSQPLQEAEDQSGGGQTKDIAFISASISGEHYPGEVVPVTLKAYFKQNYRIELNSLPRLLADGVIMPELDSRPLQRRENVAGIPYNVLVWQTSLSGIKAGRHTVQFVLDATLLVAGQRNRRTLSPFENGLFDDSLLDHFFAEVERRPIRALSVEHDFTVVPLPEAGRPESFRGAIGDFSLEVVGAPRQVEVGEPITLTMTITGNGNFNNVEAPVFPDSPAWKTYPTTASFVAGSDPSAGTKTFEQAIVARQTGGIEIPPLVLSYFNPDLGKYLTLRSEPIPLQVAESRKKALTTAKGQESGGSGEQPAVEEVAPIRPEPVGQVDDQSQRQFNLAPLHQRAGSFHADLRPFWQKQWFFVCIAACLLAVLFLSFLLYRRNRAAQGADLREKKYKEIERYLQLIEEAQRARNERLFLDRMRTAIQQYMGLLSEREPAAICLSDLKEILGEDSLLIPLFARADAAAYACASLTNDEMERYQQILKTELEKI
ncbi:MAG: hypothetical protein CSB23_04465 [Deltaproteobacteria bacterium]|nr:MAG: hypothetical protein CSB23_04465 [Deltaproteobacteria bacterium]